MSWSLHIALGKGGYRIAIAATLDGSLSLSLSLSSTRLFYSMLWTGLMGS